MKRAAFSSEAELAAVVVTWLESFGWTTYREVLLGQGGPVADIVAKRGPVTYVVETKLQFGVAVVAQANAWIRYANLVACAVPQFGTGNYDGRALLESVCSDRGIGVLLVDVPIVAASYIDTRAVNERIVPVFRRRVEGIRTVEAQRTQVAGAAGGGHWTPFKATCAEVLRLVERAPGMTLRELLGSKSYHYTRPSTARTSLAALALKGVLPGIEARREDGAIRLYPASKKRGAA